MALHSLFIVGGLTLSLLAVPGALNAQRHSDARVGLAEPTVKRTRVDASISIMPRAGESSYWKEGGIVTALAAVVAGNVLARDSSSGQRLLGTLLAAPVFFVPGALIGSLFPKK
jgi:hypothetical protein